MQLESNDLPEDPEDKYKPPILDRTEFDKQWELWKDTWTAGARKSRAYWHLLKYWDTKRFRVASRECMATCERFPTIGDVIRHMPTFSDEHWRLDEDHQPVARANLATAQTYKQMVQGWRDAYAHAAETGELTHPVSKQPLGTWPHSDDLQANFLKLTKYAEAHIGSADRRINKLKPQGDIPF